MLLLLRGIYCNMFDRGFLGGKFVLCVGLFGLVGVASYIKHRKQSGGSVFMKTFFNELESQIYKAVKDDFKEIAKKIGKEKINAISLVTDGDCITLRLSLNTVEYMEKTDADYGYSDGSSRDRIIAQIEDKLSAEEIEKYKSLPLETTKYSPDEWGYHDHDLKGGEVLKISKLLYSKNEKMDFPSEEDYLEWKKMFFETANAALQRLIHENHFGLDPNDVAYFVCMTDADEVGEEMMNNSLKLLSTQNIYEEFIKGYDEEIMTAIDSALQSLHQ